VRARGCWDLRRALRAECHCEPEPSMALGWVGRCRALANRASELSWQGVVVRVRERGHAAREKPCQSSSAWGCSRIALASSVRASRIRAGNRGDSVRARPTVGDHERVDQGLADRATHPRNGAWGAAPTCAVRCRVRSATKRSRSRETCGAGRRRASVSMPRSVAC